MRSKNLIKRQEISLCKCNCIGKSVYKFSQSIIAVEVVRLSFSNNLLFTLLFNKPELVYFFINEFSVPKL